MWAQKFEILNSLAAPELWLEEPTVEGGVPWCYFRSTSVSTNSPSWERPSTPRALRGPRGQWQEAVELGRSQDSQGQGGHQQVDTAD